MTMTGALVALLSLGAVTTAGAPAGSASSVLRAPSLATVEVRGIVVDVEAERAFLREGPNSGASVTSPAAGEPVVFHLDWRVTGSGAPVVVSIRAVLDGRVFCSTASVVSPGDLVTTFCDAPWTATAGGHTVRWDLDYTESIPETDESNNSVQQAWVSPGIGLTVVPTLEPLPSVTPTPMRAATATAVPTASPTRPPDSGPGAASVFARGDTNCSIDRTAADVVEQLAALGGPSACENDDCDRDGDVDTADVECAAGCLFGRCPVPPGAPKVNGVEAVSVPRLRALSVVRITGEGFGESPAHLTLQLGERAGEIIRLESPTELFALLPDSDAGVQELIVSAGELESAFLPVEVEPAVPVGDPDTLEDLLDGVLTLLEELLLDPEAAFGDDADVVVPLLEEKREDIETDLQDLLENPAYTPELATEIDRVIDASGTPEMVRDALSGLQGEGGGGSGETVIAAGNAMRAAGSGASLAVTMQAEAAGVAEGAAIVGGGLTLSQGIIFLGGIVVGAAASAVIGADDPVLLSVDPSVVEPGERIRISGRNLGSLLSFEPNLILVNDQGQEISLTDSVEAGEDFLVFEMPKNTTGLCGSMKTFLRLPLGLGESQDVFRVTIRPVLVEITRRLVAPPADSALETTVDGVLGCKATSSITYDATEGAKESTRRGEHSRGLRTDPVSGGPIARVSYELPLLVPGLFDVRVSVRGIESEGDDSLTVDTSLTDLPVTCPRRIVLDDTEDCETERLIYHGGSVSQRFTVEPENIADTASPRPHVLSLTPSRPGTMRVRSSIRRTDGSLNRLIVESREGTEVEAVDQERPFAELESESEEIVSPGDVIQVTARARDDFAVERIVLEATGPVPSEQRMQVFANCNPGFPEVTSSRCVHIFTVDVVRSDDPGPVVLTATAVDYSDNTWRSEPLSFSLAAGVIEGTVFDIETDAPIPGATIELLDASNRLLDSITSGGGSFAFVNVRPASYTLRASATGYAAQTEAVAVAAGETVDVPLALPPLVGVGRLNALVQRFDPANRTPIVGATVAIVNRDGTTLTQQVTGADGRVLIESIPAGEYVWTATAPGFALTAVRLDVNESGGLAGGTAHLYPANPSCTSDLDTFNVLRGSTMFGTAIPLTGGDLPRLFELASGTMGVHPDAAVICIRGMPARPTVDWDVAWADAALPRPPVDRVLFVFRRPTAPVLFDLRASRVVIFPPVGYGDTSQGVDVGPFADGTLPDLEAGELYGVTIDSSRLTLDFELR